MGSDALNCPHCFSRNIKKIPANFTVIKTGDDEQKTSKENVLDHIEENKKILKKIKQRSSEEMEVNND